MTAFYPLVLSGSQIEELQAGDTINATVSNATNATNISGGAAGSVPYQTGATATTFLSIGSAGTVITSTGTAPQWTAQSSLAVGSATNLAGGTAGALAYNTGSGATTFLSLGTSTHILTAGASAPQYTDPSTITVGSATSATSATTATNIAGGGTGALPYNSSSGTTTFLNLGTSTYILTAGASAPQYTDPSTVTVGTATNATNATNTGITDDTTTNAEMYLTWVTANTGNLPQKVTSTKLTFNPSSGVLTCTGGVSGGTF